MTSTSVPLTGDDVPELYEAYYAYTVSVCTSLLGPKKADIAEDIAQDVWMIVCKKISAFRGDCAFTTWLYKIAANRVIMHFRASACKSRLFPLDNPASVLFSCSRRMYVGGFDHSLCDRVRLENALRRLAPGYRLCFLLHHGIGYTHDEIANKLGVCKGTSKSQTYIARTLLQQILA